MTKNSHRGFPDNGLGRAFKWAAAFLQSNSSVALQTIGSVLMGLGAIPGFWWFVLLGALLVLFGLVLHFRVKPSYSELLDREQAAQTQAAATAAALQQALGSLLSRIATHCELNEVHQRISIYCHDDGEFVMLARHSQSTNLRRAGRQVYPANQGVIGEAWDKGVSMRSRWPENRLDWEQFQVDSYGFDAASVHQLAMQTRSIVALRIGDSPHEVGVLVMESTNATGVGLKHKTKAAESLMLASLGEIMASAKPHFPAVAELIKARASGTASLSL